MSGLALTNKNPIKELLEKLKDVPTLPTVASRVNELINDPNSSSADIAKVLKNDQALTAKILKLVNSPYYGIPSAVTDVQRALAFLGFNTLAQLVLSISVFSLFPSADGTEEFPLLDFWRHALATAVCSELIAKRVKYAKPEECFTCGLLHDIGKVVMRQISKDDLINIVKLAKKKKLSFVAAENELGITAHSIIGELIAEKWSLPQLIRTTIRYHHSDVRNETEVLAAMKTPIQIVSLANSLVVQMGVGHSGDYSDGEMKPYMYEVLGIKQDALDEIKKQTEEEMQKVGSFLSVK